MSESEEVEAEARDGMQLRLAKYDEHFTIHRFFLHIQTKSNGFCYY